MLEFISNSSTGAILQIHVRPFSKSSKFSAVRSDGRLVVDLAAKPKDGEANEELVRFVSSFLKIPKDSIEITSGKTNRNKTILLKNASVENIQSKIAETLEDDCKEKEKKT
jgi:uncharacterized protein (TIGR00251 family)